MRRSYDQRGASLVEYSILVALIAIVAIASVTNLTNKILVIFCIVLFYLSATDNQITIHRNGTHGSICYEYDSDGFGGGEYIF